MAFEITGVIDADEVPSWQRRQPKYEELVETMLELEPGKAIRVVFPDKDAARRAANQVRDTVNYLAKAVVISTRVTEEKGNGYLYLTKLHTESKEQDK